MAPNFEKPFGWRDDNIYDLQVYVESNGEKVYQNFTVDVRDANDAPTLDKDGSSRTIVIGTGHMLRHLIVMTRITA